MLAQCRPNHVCRSAKTATTGEQKRLKLLAITLSPVTRIQTDKQARERSIHKDSSLSNPALVNIFSVVSLARRTFTPLPVMR